jgi:ubiquinone/menaquinone biosynthesis C-methylase UbiE
MDGRTALAMAEFDHWSRSYDRSVLQRWLFEPSHELLLHHLKPQDQRLLDIGCGTALFMSRVLEKSPDMTVCGVDLSGKMLDHATKRLLAWPKQTSVTRGDSARLPFADSTFDVVTCSHSFHHYPNQRAAVREMFRVLKPGGRAMIVDGWRDRLWGLVIFDVMVRLMEGPVHHCSARKFRRLFQTAGFEQVSQYFRRGLIPFVCTIGQAAKAVNAPPMPPRKAA